MTYISLTIDDAELLTGAGSSIEAAEAPGRWISPDSTVVVLALQSCTGSTDRGSADAARRLGAAYLDRPNAWPELHHNSAAAVIVDRTRQSILAGVDPAGLHQLYYERDATSLRVATSLRALVAARSQPPQVDPQSVYDYVYYHCVPSPRTIFRGIDKLQAGQFLHLHRGALQLRRHFSVEFSTVDASFETLAADLRRHLKEAVGRSLVPGACHGAFLSGGLDSSTVAGYFAQLAQPAQAPTVSIGFDAKGYDEIEFARIAARHFGTRAIEYYVTPQDICDEIHAIAGAFDEPFGNSSAVPVYFCARVARQHGIDRMLAGDGGDELFAGNYRYAKQALFERYTAIPRSLRSRMVEPLLLNSPLGHLPGLRKAASYVRQARIPMPDRLQSYNFLHRHAPTDVFSDGLLESVHTEHPLQQWRNEFNVHPDADIVDRMLFLDWKFTLHDNDLVKVNTMCGLAGVDVAYPMLDEALLRFSCTVPASLKLRNGQLRWFYKQAMAGFLPQQIIDKGKHGFGLPFGFWLREHQGLRRMAEAALESLASRSLFNPQFLQQALRLHRDDSAGYYGDLLWVAIMLELWMQKNLD